MIIFFYLFLLLYTIQLPALLDIDALIKRVQEVNQRHIPWQEIDGQRVEATLHDHDFIQGVVLRDRGLQTLQAVLSGRAYFPLDLLMMDFLNATVAFLGATRRGLVYAGDHVDATLDCIDLSLFEPSPYRDWLQREKEKLRQERLRILFTTLQLQSSWPEGAAGEHEEGGEAVEEPAWVARLLDEPSDEALAE